MSRFRLIILSAFAVFAAGAFASSSASADACSGGTQSVFCFSNNTPIHSEKGLGTIGLALFATTVGITEVRLHCKDGVGSGTFKLLGLAKGEVAFLGCTVEKPANCTVGEGVNKLILAKFHLQLSSGLMPATGLATGTGTGVPEEFTKITIAGASCSVANSYTVSGLQTVEFPKGEESLVGHEAVAKKSGSKIKVGAEAGSFSATSKVDLSSGAAFLIMLGV